MEGNWFIYSTEGVVIIVLLFCSALVSGSEVAYFSLSPKQIEACRNSGNLPDHNIALLLRNPKKVLATVLILNNLVNIGIVTLSTYMLINAIGNDTDDAALAFSLLTLGITFLIVFFGEVVPKVYSNQRALQFARFTSTGMLFMSHVVSPLSWALMQMGNLLEKQIKRKGYQASIDEINEALELTTTTETTDEEREILRGIVNFGTISVKQIMRPRMDMSVVDRSLPFCELLKWVNESGYSRLPVANNTIDKIDGILYIKDLLPHLDEADDFQWHTLIRREIFFVPENKKIDQLLKDFQSRRVHMAIVVDEYGGTSGLITLEDIIEEIMGEINDEFDTADLVYKQIDPTTWSFEGKTPFYDFCKVLDIDPSIFQEIKGDGETLAGLMLELFARMPRAGERKRFNNFIFTIVTADKKRIKNVRVTIKNAEAAPKETAGQDQKKGSR